MEEHKNLSKLIQKEMTMTELLQQGHSDTHYNFI